jgi:hypothetical protein
MNNEQYDIIEQYLNGELSGEALIAFEEQLKNDNELAAELQLYKNIEHELKQSQQNEAEENALTATLKNLGAQHFTTTAKPAAKVAAMRRIWPYAAAAAIVIIFFISKTLFTSTTSSEKLYAEYAVPEKLSAIVRGANNDSLTITAVNFFNQQSYIAALPLLKMITEEDTTHADLMLALGISQLQTGNAPASISTFEKLITGETIYKYEGTFWKALALLKQDKRAGAKKILEQIPEGSSAYEKAGKLLKEL